MHGILFLINKFIWDNILNVAVNNNFGEELKCRGVFDNNILYTDLDLYIQYRCLQGFEIF